MDQPGVLTIDILKESSHRLLLVDAASHAPLYRIHNSSLERSVNVARASNEPIGHADFHSLSSDIDIQIYNQHGRMAYKSFFSLDSVLSGVPGLSWAWRPVSWSTRFQCVDDYGGVVAYFKEKSLSWSKRGTISVRADVAGDMRALDWLVVTAMAKMELERKQRASQLRPGGAGI